MRKKRYTAKQIVQIFKDADKGEESISDVFRRCEVLEATF